MTLYAKDLFEEAEPFITYEKDKKTKIATITIRMADQLNAVTTGMRLRYVDYIHRANIDDDVKVLVIRSEGEHLGTGADLGAQFKGYDEGPNNSPLHEFEIDDLDVARTRPDDVVGLEAQIARIDDEIEERRDQGQEVAAVGAGADDGRVSVGPTVQDLDPRQDAVAGVLIGDVERL